jgi:protein AATF/BFR2
MKSISKKRTSHALEEEPLDEEITSSEDEKEPDGDGENERTSKSRKVSVIPQPPKRKKQKLEDLESLATIRYNQLVPFKTETIQKWNEKTQLSFGKYGKKTPEISTLKQIDHILSNKEKLIKRTHVKRSAYKTIGKVESNDMEEEDASDSEIFDDDDFYHQLLRELIERKTSNVSDPVQLSRHWLELQKMRSKLKKKVDTKASKGRKIRYDVHPKLVNFMAPEENCTMSENAIKELMNSLFGKLS